MHSSLTVGGAHEVVEELEKLIAQQVREAKIEAFDIAFDCHDYDRLRAYRDIIVQLLAPWEYSHQYDKVWTDIKKDLGVKEVEL
jgi:hypothetical protein